MTPDDIAALKENTALGVLLTAAVTIFGRMMRSWFKRQESEDLLVAKSDAVLTRLDSDADKYRTRLGEALDDNTHIRNQLAVATMLLLQKGCTVKELQLLGVSDTHEDNPEKH